MICEEISVFMQNECSVQNNNKIIHFRETAENIDRNGSCSYMRSYCGPFLNIINYLGLRACRRNALVKCVFASSQQQIPYVWENMSVVFPSSSGR